jgi:hypothetical protein
MPANLRNFYLHLSLSNILVKLIRITGYRHLQFRLYHNCHELVLFLVLYIFFKFFVADSVKSFVVFLEILRDIFNA